MTESDDDERQTFSEGTDSGREDEEDKEKQEIKRGRPVGKADSNQRYRRTAQEISNDKICVAQMKLDAMREKEDLKLANKKVSQRRGKPPPVTIPPKSEERVVSPKKERHPKQKIKETRIISGRERSPESYRTPSPTPKSLDSAGRRRQLYDSWFLSSPRTSHAY